MYDCGIIVRHLGHGQKCPGLQHWTFCSCSLTCSLRSGIRLKPSEPAISNLLQITASQLNGNIFLFVRLRVCFCTHISIDIQHNLYTHTCRETKNRWSYLDIYLSIAFAYFLATICQNHVCLSRSGSLEQLAVQLETILFISYYLFTEKRVVQWGLVCSGGFMWKYQQG